MKETLMKSAYIGEDGKLKVGYVPMSKSSFGKPEGVRIWTDEIEKYKTERIVWLQKKIAEVETKLNEELSEWDRYRYNLFKDQLNIDLREDRLLIKYKGQIPKAIDERCVKKSTETQMKYQKMLGKEKFIELLEDVNVTLWDYIIREETTTGGGKY